MLQSIRAAASFMKKPWYDCAAITAGPGQPVEYGQIRALFHLPSADGQQRELALVRMYARCTPAQQQGHFLSARGNVMLKWAGPEFDEATFRQGSDAAVLRKLRSSYQVVMLAHLVRSEYIVPDYSELQVQRFFVSKYKWDRQAADTRSLKELYGDKCKGVLSG